MDFSEISDEAECWRIARILVAEPDGEAPALAQHQLDVSIASGSGVAGDQAFTQVASFTGVADQMTLAFDAGTNTITLRGDTDGLADFSILFTGDVTGLTASWLRRARGGRGWAPLLGCIIVFVNYD